MLTLKPITVNRIKTAAGRFQNSAGSISDSFKMPNGHLVVFLIMYTLDHITFNTY